MTGWSSSGLVQSRVLAGVLMRASSESDLPERAILSRKRAGAQRYTPAMDELAAGTRPGWSRRRFLSAGGVAAATAVAAMAGAAPQLPGSRRLPPEERLSARRRDAARSADVVSSRPTTSSSCAITGIRRFRTRRPGGSSWTARSSVRWSSPWHSSRRCPATSVTCVLQCAGNGRGLYRPTVPGVQWRTGAVGNAKWTRRARARPARRRRV